MPNCVFCGGDCRDERPDKSFECDVDIDGRNKIIRNVCPECCDKRNFDKQMIIDEIRESYVNHRVSWLEDNSETIQKRFASLLNTGDIISATVEDKTVALLRYLKDLAKGCPR
jgi:hypothetical protein